MLEQTKDLTQDEREIVLATASWLAYLPYDTDFYDRSVEALEYLNKYDASVHSKTIDFLVRERVDLLQENDPQGAWAMIKESIKDESGLSGKTDEEQYAEFETAYSLARIKYTVEMESLKRDVSAGIGVEDNGEETTKTASYKTDDIYEMLRERLFDDAFRRRHGIKRSNMPYLKAIYESLEEVLQSKPEDVTKGKLSAEG
jgi:hypothetical protein